jgi:hypothetical protein
MLTLSSLGATMALCSLCSHLKIEEFAYRDKPKLQPFGDDDASDDEEEDFSDDEEIERTSDGEVVTERSLKDYQR